MCFLFVQRKSHTDCDFMQIACFSYPTFIKFILIHLYEVADDICLLFWFGRNGHVYFQSKVKQIFFFHDHSSYIVFVKYDPLSAG